MIMDKIMNMLTLRQLDLPDMIESVSYMLKGLMINIDSRDTKRVPLYFNLAIGFLAACNCYCYFISVIWFVFWRCQQLQCERVTAVISFSLGVGNTTSLMKLIFIILYPDAFKSIVDGYLTCNALVEPGSRFSKNLLITMRKVKKRIVCLWIIILLDYVLYVYVKPVVSNTVMTGRHLMDDKYVLLGLQPMMESPNYELSWTIIACGTTFFIYACLANFTLFLTMTGYIEAQMTALSEELTHLWNDAQNHYLQIITNSRNGSFITQAGKDKILNEHVCHRLIDIAKRHTMNIKLLHELESIFQGALAIEFILVIVALIADLLVGLESTYLEVPYLFLHTGIDCWTGQLVMDASITFERAVYNCKWEHFDRVNMKIVLLMLKNSQRTMQLSAGGITALSFTTWMSILKSVYSTYTTLRSTMTK